MAEVVTTYLEMNSPAELKPRPSPDPQFVIGQVVERQWQLNRYLYAVIGERWSWTDRLLWSDDWWENYVESDNLRTFVALYDGRIAGYYELRRDDAEDVEIVYFGLAPQMIGRGYGAALLTEALQNAWAWKARRVWVHTCTRDHPAALQNCRARGMTIYDEQRQEIA
jgi:GNAT superfamily N-acetyltransferase